MNSVRKALLAIVATVALAASIAGCAADDSDTIDTPDDNAYIQAIESQALVYTKRCQMAKRQITIAPKHNPSESLASFGTSPKPTILLAAPVNNTHLFTLRPHTVDN